MTARSTWGDRSIFPADHATELPQLCDQAWDKLRAAFGQMGSGERLAYLLMEAAAQNGRISQSKLAAISDGLAALLPPFGLSFNPALLVAIGSGAGQVAAADGPSPKQEAFVNRLVEAGGIART
jgi:hypothetical protein